MKNIKRAISFLIIFATIISIFSVTSLAAEQEEPTRNNNTAYTSTSFSITTSGIAQVYVKYTGYPNVTTGATIDIVIKKNTFLFFWSTVVDESYNIVGENYSHTYEYDISSNGSGTYKCFVTYTVSGTGGPDDVLDFDYSAVY